MKKTVILVTHDLDEAIRLADQIAIMNSGKLIQYDTPEIILTKPADKFVHDFVGTDRALKRLSRINIEGYIKSALAINIRASIQEAITTMGNRPSIWVVDDENCLLGWIDRRHIKGSESIEQALVRGGLDEISIMSGSTLREALSRMLGLGFKNIPVINETKCLVGELSLSDVEAATVEFEI